MKFENNRFRFELEKKPRTEEQKEKARMTRKRFGKIAIALLLVAAILAGGYGAVRMGWIGGPDGEYVEASNLAQSLKNKYADKQPFGYTYGEPMQGLKRDAEITIPVGFDLSEAEFEYWYEIFAIYQDAELTNRLSPICEYDAENGVIRVTPPHYTVGNISTSGLTMEEVRKYDHSEYFLFEKDAGGDWGNIGTLYLAKYWDMETGEKLDKPEVSIITMEGEVTQNPRIEFSVAEDGRASLRWEPVEDATDYVICLVEYDEENGFDGSARPIDMTSDNSWVLESPEFSYYPYTNEQFKNFDVCEDDWLSEDSAERATDWYGVTEGVYKDDEDEKYLCVIALNENGTSMFSNMYAVEDIAPALPYHTAGNAEDASGFKVGGYDSIEQVSAYGYVTMCDGYTATKLVDYQTQDAKVIVDRYIIIDEEGNYIEGENVPVLEIPYVIEGTPFEYVAKIVDYDEANFEKDMAYLEDREEQLRKKSGDVSLKIAWGRMDEEEIRIPRGEKIKELDSVEVTANCALSEYLATAMLGGTKVIDLSEFPEAQDQEFLMDAWMEAYYQNPLILGVSGYRINRKGTAMRVEYDEDTSTTARKQEKILDIVPEIIDEIITEDMSDLEKELAINEYLCDTIEYDNDALENAEENDFMSVDEEYIDSFTAYGALINGRCVCAGYAAAFKLLAQEAGIDSIVVTGFLDGNLAHAWNKVKIDGEWEILDVTNNDDEYLTNALLNLPNYAGDRVLVEDKEYAVDRYLSDYDATNEDNEFYRINRKYYDYEDIGDELIEELEENETAVLRTEYDLDDDMFYEITDYIYEEMGDDIELRGYYWMGVIYLQMEEDV